MKLRFVFLVFFVPLLTIAQYNLDKVTKSQLEEKFYPADSTASAAFLFKTCKLKFDYNAETGFSIVAEYTLKLKIYKLEGLSWADITIPYYVGYKTLNKDVVTNVKGYTYNLIDGEIVRQKVTSEGRVDIKTNEFWAKKIVAFPSVKVGSIIELNYEIRSQDIQSIDLMQLQHAIPVAAAKLKIEIPLFFTYKIIRFGKLEFDLRSKVNQNSINYVAKVGSSRANSDYYLQFNQVVNEAELKNIPALKEEPFTNDINDYYSKIALELESVQFPDEPQKKYATTWSDVAKMLNEHEKFGKALQNSDYYIDDFNRIANDNLQPKEFMLAIFEWVKKQISWNKNKGYFSSQPLDEAYQKRSGSVADINLILISFLRMGGFDAHPVLLSTRENGAITFPSYSYFNYVVVGVKLENQLYLLDASQHAGTSTLLPTMALNDKGQMFYANGNVETVNLMPSTLSLKNTSILTKVDKDGSLSGQVKCIYTDYKCWDVLADYSASDKDNWTQQKEKKWHLDEITNYGLNDLKDKVVAEELFEFKSHKYIESIGDKLLISPLLFQSIIENPFKSDTREYPVHFSYPNREKATVVFTIPEGYSIQSFPKDVAFSLPDNAMSYKFVIAVNGNQMTVIRTLDCNQAEFSPDLFPSLKEFLTLVVSKETEKIVLIKQ
ncbi:transglutaminase domain-containing protein [Flavobacterium stagni]|uniref:DUF3857 domain-containing protein n=1 Tax=Flavobacterium stagni TaxID=2506421 RepID=A0A4Q1KBC7_9FLAO|nr:transglutaminase domain-containing protein [Flavobacterium stagni]RXR22215.1 DUF3857 domain-containing protein [Flavobacterium stagni]